MTNHLTPEALAELKAALQAERTVMSSSTAWPEGVIARYRADTGATVDITYDNRAGTLTATCTGERCPWQHRQSVEALYTDTAEQEAARVDEWLPISQRHAQTHAETCRAMPKPTN